VGSFDLWGVGHCSRLLSGCPVINGRHDRGTVRLAAVRLAPTPPPA